MNLKLLILLISPAFVFFSCKDNGADDRNSDCLTTNLQNGLIASYTFGNGSLNDGIAGNDLSNLGGATPTADRDGNASCAYALDGQQRLTRANPTFLNNLQDFSVSIWYHPVDTTREGGFAEYLLTRGDSSSCISQRGQWAVFLYDCRQAVFVHGNEVWADSPLLGQGTCQDIINSLTDKWLHVVAVKENNTYRIYFNGVLMETAIGNVGCPMPPQDLGDLFLGTNFKGYLDDVFIYNRALSATEVQALFLADACCE